MSLAPVAPLGYCGGSPFSPAPRVETSPNLVTSTEMCSQHSDSEGCAHGPFAGGARRGKRPRTVPWRGRLLHPGTVAVKCWSRASPGTWRTRKRTVSRVLCPVCSGPKHESHAPSLAWNAANLTVPSSISPGPGRRCLSATRRAPCPVAGWERLGLEVSTMLWGEGAGRSAGWRVAWVAWCSPH